MFPAGFWPGGFSQACSTFTLTGPATATSGQLSAPFTLTLGPGQLGGQAVFTPRSTAAGDRFVPASLALNDSVRDGVFRLIPASAGVRGVWALNDRGLVGPPALSVAAGQGIAPVGSGSAVSFLVAGGEHHFEVTPPYEVTMVPRLTGGSIYYTLNGTTPSRSNGSLYAGPVKLALQGVILAVMVRGGYTGPLTVVRIDFPG